MGADLAEKIPGVRASNRAYVVYLNRLRADMFDAMSATLARNGEPTMAEYKAIAQYINVATGRGSFGKKFDKATDALAAVFFSPRYVASRFNFIRRTGAGVRRGGWRRRRR
jgi:hypothetical protein